VVPGKLESWESTGGRVLPEVELLFVEVIVIVSGLFDLLEYAVAVLSVGDSPMSNAQDRLLMA
jgi:hypothetical protein